MRQDVVSALKAAIYQLLCFLSAALTGETQSMRTWTAARLRLGQTITHQLPAAIHHFVCHSAPPPHLGETPYVDAHSFTVEAGTYTVHL